MGFSKNELQIIDADTSAPVAKLKMPILATYFTKIKCEYQGGRTIEWGVKSFYSIHWEWREDDKVIVEAVEDITGADSSGIVSMASYDEYMNVLIMLGFFLSLRRKHKLTMGLQRFFRKKGSGFNFASRSEAKRKKV